MQAANKVFNNTIFLYIKMLITVFVSLYTTRIILESIGVSDFGIYTLILGILNMLMFLNSSLAQSSQRFMSIAKGKNDSVEETTIFNISIFLHLIVALVLVSFFLLIKTYLFNNMLLIEPDRINTAQIIYDFMLIGIFFMIIAIPYDAIINANENMLFVAIVGIIESLVKLMIAISITYYNGDQLYLYGLLMSFIFIMLYAIKGIYSHIKYKEAKFELKKIYEKKVINNMTSFAGWTFVGTSSQMITNYGQGLIINIFFGTVINAAQGIAAQVSGQIGSFAVNMLKALNPMITKSEGAGNRELMLLASFSGSKISFYLLMLFYIPILIEMEVIFNLWLVEVPEYTIIFCQLLLIRNLIEQLYLTLYTSIISVGNIKEFQIYNSIINLAPLPITYLFFSNNYEPEIIYIIFIFYSLIHGYLHIYFAKKECGMSIKEYLNKVILKSVIPFTIVFSLTLIPYLLIENSTIRFFSVIIVSFSFFLITVWIFGLNNYEKAFIKNKLYNIRRKFDK